MLPFYLWILLVCCLQDLLESSNDVQLSERRLSFYTATITVSYHVDGKEKVLSDSGMYGINSEIEERHGNLIHVRTEDNMTHGCTPPVNAPKSNEPWIALVQRGDCKFNSKIHNLYTITQANAVVVYDYHDSGEYILMNHDLILGAVSVTILHGYGKQLADLVDGNIPVVMNISVNHKQVYNLIPETLVPMRTNSTMVAISLCLVGLLVIGVVLLIVYIVKRAKVSRNSPHLMNVLVRNDEVLLNSSDCDSQR